VTGWGAGGATGDERREWPSESSPLVGRDAELARLDEARERAFAGRRQVVFVTGEPGIGKTALVEAFLARLDPTAGLRVGRGQCIEQYGAGEPYLPLLEALGRLGRAPGGGQLVDVLRQHAPTWLAQLPSLLTDADLDLVQRRAQGATRERMLRELVEELDALAAHAPLVLVLEDLHWSDSATVDVLAMLARRREGARLLVLGTYRPADVAVAGHPVRGVKQELQVHGHCVEVPLDFLGVAAVVQYLARRFPGHRFPPELAGVLHRTTDGNPLFLVNTLDYLAGEGLLRESDGHWALAAPLETIAVVTPRTLWQMVEKQLERRRPEEQVMLAVASVAGAELSAGVGVVAGIDPDEAERRCEALARSGQFLRGAGVAEWPDGTVAGRYAFIHALYQKVIYARVPAGERSGWHLRMGERLERAYGSRAPEIAGELAVHFEEGRDVARAARYQARAGEHALGQHAYREAADHATRALDLLAAVPESRERLRQELALRVLLASALTATHGYAVPAVAQAYARARDLCGQGGDTAELWPVLLGLARYYLVRGELPTSREISRQLAGVADATADALARLAADNTQGVGAFYAGEFAAALDPLQRGIALYDPDRSRAFRLGQDLGVSCLIHVAFALWALGHPERAAARMREALALARTLGDPFSRSYACLFAAILHQWLGDLPAMRALADEGLALDQEHGFALFLASGAVFRGWLLAVQGRGEEGLRQIREALDQHRAIGAEVLVPLFLALLADVQDRLGLVSEGLSSVAEALAAGQASGARYWEAEAHRLRGVLLLRQASAGGGRPRGRGGRASPAVAAAAEKEAESSFLQAIEVARRQQAASLELRAATGLARLWQRQARTREAHALLGDVLGRFTEGFETADLNGARALLSELGPQPKKPAIDTRG
jgi:predicted ATPase